jgi:hypothetical protein
LLHGLLWGQTSSIPQDPKALAAACRTAQADFHPISKEDLQQCRAQLAAAAARLDQRLGRAAASGDDWRRYVHWTDLDRQIKQPGDLDPAAIEDLHKHFAAGHQGLELAPFADVRQALKQYEELAGADNVALKTEYAERLESLAGQLEAYAAHPTAETQQDIAESLAWLRNHRQAPALIAATGRYFDHPNGFIQLSAGLVSAGINRMVDEPTTVDDVILGTTIHGTGQTRGETQVSLVPSSDYGAFDAILHTATTSQNAGRNGPVCIYSNGQTWIGACKRFWLTADGLSTYPAVSNAETQTNIYDIEAVNGRRLIETFAWRRAGKQLGEAESIASSHAEWRANQRVDAEAAGTLADNNEKYRARLRRPLSERNVYPQRLAFSTEPTAISIQVHEAGPDQLAADTGAPPALPADLLLRVHQSMLDNMAGTVLSGMILQEEDFQSAVKTLLGRVPEQFKPDDEQSSWTVVFARRQPITVGFADGGFQVVLRGREFIKGEKHHPAMNITAKYTFVKTDAGFKAVRQGPLEIFPPGFVPGKSKSFSLPQQIARSLLQRRFGKLFAAEFAVQGFTPSGKWSAAGKLQPVELSAQNGWLVIGYKVPASGH